MEDKKTEEKKELNIYVGKNSSGKSFLIKDIIKKMDDVIKKIDDPQKMDDLTKYTTFLYKLIIDKIEKKLQLSENELERINSNLNEFNDNIKKIFDDKDIDDKFILGNIGKGIKVNSDYYVQNFNFDGEIRLGTGHNFYKLLSIAIKYFAFNKSDHFAIDEPERFLHPELQIKFAKKLIELNKKIKLSIVSHSPIFINEISSSIEDFKIVEKYYLNDKRKLIQDFTKELKQIKWNEIYEKNKNAFNEYHEIMKRKGNNYSELIAENFFETANNYLDYINKYFKKEIIEAVFWEKIILVEGLLEKEIIKYRLKDKNYYVIDCKGKGNVLILSLIFKHLKFNYLSIIDKDAKKDKTGDWKKLNDYFDKNRTLINENDIEEELGIDKYNKRNCAFFIATIRKYINKNNEIKEVESEKMNKFLNKIINKFE